MSEPYVEGLGTYIEAVRNHPRLLGESGVEYAERITAIVKNGGKSIDREPGSDDE